MLSTWLDEVPGLGEKAKQQVLKNLNQPKESLRGMNGQELGKLLGVTPTQGAAIARYLNQAIDEDEN